MVWACTKKYDHIGQKMLNMPFPGRRKRGSVRRSKRGYDKVGITEEDIIVGYSEVIERLIRCGSLSGDAEI